MSDDTNPRPLDTHLFPDQLCEIGDDLRLFGQDYVLVDFEHDGDGRVLHYPKPRD